MKGRLPKALNAVLWKHQSEAVNKMFRYVAAFDRKAPQSALVHMPTGSGKTAVIASLARCSGTPGPVLVVTPASGCAVSSRRTSTRASSNMPGSTQRRCHVRLWSLKIAMRDSARS